ncbi:MAG TPA: DUF6491 family protein [Allosphingosinicella sp.]|jgi:hypothetical protein
MRNKTSLLLLILAGGCAGATAPSRIGETYIPYVSSNGVNEWRIASDNALYVRAITGGWYLVRTLGRCSALRYARTIGFETSALGQLDRHGALRVEQQRCPVDSVTRSDAPPEKKRQG